MHKTKRNDPCPCGSEKKFKHCCLSKTINTPSLNHDIELQKLREIEGKIFEGTTSFASKQLEEEIIEDGWKVFCLDHNIEKDSTDGEHLFPGWFVFRWIPSDYFEKWKHLGPNLTLSELYLQQNPDKECETFLSSVKKSPFSFFLVEDVIPGKNLILKDLLLDKTITIKEQRGSVESFRGQIVFGRLISIENQDIQIGFGTTPLPVRYAINVLDLKKSILKTEKNLTSDTLLKYDDELRQSYFDWSESTYKPPKIYNTDGDPIAFCTIHYKLKCTPKIAFDHLISLCKGEKPTDMLECGEFDKKGELYSIEFPWFKNLSTRSILGDIKIKGNKLTIEVNSIERSKKIQKEIEKQLPEAIFKKLDTDKLDLEKIKENKKQETSASVSSPIEKETIKTLVQNHYRDWVDMSIPALNGKTPRQAAKTDEGRERLEYLLLEFERSNQNKEDEFSIDVQSVRKELGLLKIPVSIQ